MLAERRRAGRDPAGFRSGSRARAAEGAARAIVRGVHHGGIPQGMATNDVERYCVWPGQACSYMVGKTAWVNHRERARRALGELFDIRDFHRATLAVGAVPLTILDRVVDDYIAEAHARRR